MGAITYYRKLQFFHCLFVVAVDLSWVWFLFLFSHSSDTSNIINDGLSRGIARVVIFMVVSILIGTNTLISALLLLFDRFILTWLLNIIFFAFHLTMPYEYILEGISISKYMDIPLAELVNIHNSIFAFVLCIGICCWAYILASSQQKIEVKGREEEEKKEK